MTAHTYSYSVRCPRYRTTYYRSFGGAYDRAVALLVADDEIAEPTRDYGYDDGLGIWKRRDDGGWDFDHVNTDAAWREAAEAMELQ